jgi:2-amino-4-hydroxy-6-hydroxymethyldihydropteridine diphosphokinase
VSTVTYLGLGSNLGDRLGTLQRAVEALGAQTSIRVRRSSRVYETDAVGGPEQPDFLNAVIEVETTLDANELLRVCRDIEDRLGRIRAERWGPRTIDVDILTFDRESIDEEELTVPHPRMHERGFVLAPLMELEPDPHLPGGRQVSDLRLGGAAISGVRPFAPPLVIR